MIKSSGIRNLTYKYKSVMVDGNYVMRIAFFDINTTFLFHASQALKKQCYNLGDCLMIARGSKISEPVLYNLSDCDVLNAIDTEMISSPHILPCHVY